MSFNIALFLIAFFFFYFSVCIVCKYDENTHISSWMFKLTITECVYKIYWSFGTRLLVFLHQISFTSNSFCKNNVELKFTNSITFMKKRGLLLEKKNFTDKYILLSVTDNHFITCYVQSFFIHRFILWTFAFVSYILE